MRLSFDATEKIVGTFMVIITILILTMVVMIGRGKDWFKTYITYYTVFDEAYNLGPNARVKLYKADIGKVKSVRLEENKVKVKLAILADHSQQIKVDSVATVESPTLIGSEYVSIKPGTPQASPIPENGTIPSKSKRSLADFMEEFEVEKTGKMIIRSLQEISEIVAHLRNPEGPLYSSLDSMAKSLAHLEALTHEIRDGKGSVGKLVQSEELLERIYEELNHVNGILRHVEDVTAKTPDIMDDIKQSMTMINQILANIEKGSQDVPAVTKRTKHGIREVRDAVDEADKVVQSVQESFFIKSNLPPEPEGEDIDTGLRR